MRISSLLSVTGLGFQPSSHMEDFECSVRIAFPHLYVEESSISLDILVSLNQTVGAMLLFALKSFQTFSN